MLLTSFVVVDCVECGRVAQMVEREQRTIAKMDVVMAAQRPQMEQLQDLSKQLVPSVLVLTCADLGVCGDRDVCNPPCDCTLVALPLAKFQHVFSSLCKLAHGGP
jgi:hypothetical protein